MFEYARKLYDFQLDYARLLVRDIDDARLAEQPVSGMNHGAWILGHMAISTDFALPLFGEPKVCSEDWHARFGPGSVVQTDRGAYPGKEELLDALARGHEAVARASMIATPEAMERLHPVEIAFLKQSLPTVGDLVSHLMTTHEAIHLGQLSAWRRALGMPGVLQLS